MTTIQDLSTDMAQVIEQSGSAIVRVEGRRRLAASGIIWSADGVIISAHHVVERDDGIHVGLSDGSVVDAVVVGREPGIDLAVLRIEQTELSPAIWATSNGLRVGNLALALGRPGLNIQATLGIVSALGGEWRSHAGGTIDAYLQTDVVMYPGFSGGPLVCANGQFAGMNTSGLTRGVSVTIPSQTLHRVVDAILTHGHVPRGYIGIGVQPVRLADALRSSVNQEMGLMVMSVEQNGPADQAGIVQGDVLISLNDEAVRQVSDLQSLLRTIQVGAQLQIRLLRGGTTHQLGVTVGSSTT